MKVIEKMDVHQVITPFAAALGLRILLLFYKKQFVYSVFHASYYGHFW